MPITPELGRPKQEDLCVFKAGPVYIVRLSIFFWNIIRYNFLCTYFNEASKLLSLPTVRVESWNLVSSSWCLLKAIICPSLGDSQAEVHRTELMHYLFLKAERTQDKNQIPVVGLISTQWKGDFLIYEAELILHAQLRESALLESQWECEGHQSKWWQVAVLARVQSSFW